MALTKTSSSEQTNEIESLVPTKEVQMGITAEGLQHILTRLTEMYPDALEATIREVVSNAVDATVRAGSSKPVEIASPFLENLLIVRDYGTGMSLQEVEEIYCQYGASIKRDDFSAIGAYGLGAKAPLSYTDNVQIKTVKDGKAVFFTMSKSARGYVTNIDRVKDTSEDNGTIVTVPLKSDDVSRAVKMIENYQKYSFDAPISVDNSDLKASEDFIVAGEVVLDEDSGTTGRVWMNPNLFFRRRTHSFWLSGWLYNNPYSYAGYRDIPSVLVELKPGVVDFVSSRDAITKNERVAKINDIVAEFMASEAPQKAWCDWVLEVFDPSDISKNTTLVSDLRNQVNYNRAQNSDVFDELFTKVLSNGLTIEEMYKLDTQNGESPASRVFGLDSADVNSTSSGVRLDYQNHPEGNFSDESKRSVAALPVLNSFGGNTLDLTVITGVNEDNITKIRPARRSFVLSRDEKRHKTNIFLYLEALSDLKSAELDYIKNMFGESYSEISLDDYLERSKEYRKQNRTKNTVKADFSIFKRNDENWHPNWVRVPVSTIDFVSELVNEGIETVVFNKNNYADPNSTVFGAINKGLSVGEKVAMVHTMPKSLYTSLENEEILVITDSFSHSKLTSKYVEEALEDKIFASSSISAIVKNNITPEEAYRRLVPYYPYYRNSDRDQAVNHVMSEILGAKFVAKSKKILQERDRISGVGIEDEVLLETLKNSNSQLYTSFMIYKKTSAIEDLYSIREKFPETWKSFLNELKANIEAKVADNKTI